MAKDRLLHMTDEDFNNEVKEGVLLLDLWAPWCGPCMMLTPILEEVATAVGDKARIAKLNIDEEQATADRFGVRAIPTLLLFKDGREIRRFVGVQERDTLVAAIEDAVKI